MMNGSRNKILTKGLIIFFAAGALLWWFFSFAATRESAGGLTSALARPFWHLGGASASLLESSRSFFLTRQILLDENEELRQALAESEWRVLDYRRLARDNLKWREIFNRLTSSTEAVTVARILTRVTQSPDDLVVADVGASNAVWPLAPGDPVLAASHYGQGETGLILGEVFEVYGQTSKLRLYSGSGSELEVFIGPERLPATASGRGNGNFRIWLPRDSVVEIGDSITLIRGGVEYVLGFIEVIEREPVEALQEIIFRQPVNLNLLTEVEIYAQ